MSAGGLDHVLDDRKAETAPSRRAGAVGAEEALEQARRVVLGNAGTVVARLEHDAAVLAPQRKRAGRAFAGVPDGVLEQILYDRSKHPGTQRHEDPLVFDLDPEREAGELRALQPLVDDGPQDRRRFRLAQRDHLASLLELAEEEDVVDKLGHLLDLPTCFPNERLQVGAGKLGALEKREQPGERRAELVRNRGRERSSELLVL